MNQQRRHKLNRTPGHADHAGQRGQSTVEFIVMGLVLIPLFFMVVISAVYLPML